MNPFLSVTVVRARRSPWPLAAMIVLLSLAACVQQPIVSRTPEPVPQAPPPVRPPLAPPPVVTQPPLLPTPTPSTRPIPSLDNYPKSLATSAAVPAVQALARQAQAFRSAGRHQDALGQYERALRIEPKNAFVWQAIAETQLALHDVEQAESAARKSNSLARGNPWVELGNWRVIASARGANGDSAGANAARARADEIGSAITASGAASAAAAPAAVP